MTRKINNLDANSYNQWVIKATDNLRDRNIISYDPGSSDIRYWDLTIDDINAVGYLKFIDPDMYYDLLEWNDSLSMKFELRSLGFTNLHALLSIRHRFRNI